MSKTKTGSNAQFTSAGKGLTVIGDYAYAYSGAVTDIVQADTTLLDFNTGKGFIKAKFQFQTQTTDDDIRFTISLNNIVVMGYTIGSSNNHAFQDAINIIIPPLTQVKCFGYNESSGTQRTGYASMTGKLYG
jgi:hypothetical protein